MPQVLAASLILSVLWGIYLVGTVRLYLLEKGNQDRRQSDTVIALRRIVVAFCAWAFVLSFVLRTAAVLLGVGDQVAGQVAFYALVGINFTGSIFAIVSLRYD